MWHTIKVALISASFISDILRIIEDLIKKSDFLLFAV